MKHFTLIIIMASFSTMCAAQRGSSEDDGIIERIVDEKAYPCFYVHEGSTREREYVIDSGHEYSGYVQRFQTPCDFPDIDFNNHTLLGMYGGGNNYCHVEYRRHVENDKVGRRYIFTLTVIEKGFCKRAVRWRWHWVLVPRLPEGYGVEFRKIRIREKTTALAKERPASQSDKDRGYRCPGITGSRLTPGASGIAGRTVRGPTRPVNIAGDTTDSYVPFQSACVVKSAVDNKEVARFTSDVKGEFTVSLAPGKYIIEFLRVGGRQWPRPPSPCVVEIQAGAYVEMSIRYDTGIR